MTVFFPQGIGQVAEVLISIKRLQVINIFLFDSFTSQIQLCSHLCRYEWQESGTYNVCIIPIVLKLFTYTLVTVGPWKFVVSFKVTIEHHKQCSICSQRGNGIIHFRGLGGMQYPPA